ncbi:hypothetical protein [Pseudomonas shirazensis]|uniref:hypothetical protein n=1 Tax=Pseudomonas shirazensis TaxID=2745494 RepID=UPI003D28B5E0
MPTDLDALLSSIRDCKTYEALTSRRAIIKENKDAATAVDVVRALRDAEVYALVWGVFTAALEQGAPIVAHDRARDELYIAMDKQDDSAIEGASIIYEASFIALNKAHEEASKLVDDAIKAVTDDAAKAAPGVDGIDAIADAAAADMCSAAINRHLVQQDVIYPSEQPSADPFRDYYDKQRQIRNITSPVEEACQAYVNEHVIRARVVAELKQSLNRYLLVWRKTTTGGGNPLAEQGILERIDEKNETFVLKSTVYRDQRSTVSFSDIGGINTSRTGSGAQSAAAAPGWRSVGIGKWVRSDQY